MELDITTSNAEPCLCLYVMPHPGRTYVCESVFDMPGQCRMGRTHGLHFASKKKSISAPGLKCYFLLFLLFSLSIFSFTVVKLH